MIINHPIKPEKERAWHFKSHPYFTKQAHNVVAEYIEHYSNEGDTILDPFGGTGVTAIEALRLKRKVVIVDINPLACFLIKQTVEQTDLIAFKRIFYELKETAKNVINGYYSLSEYELNKQTIDYWYPKNIKLPRNSDFSFVHLLYSKRQLLSYSYLFNQINQISNESIKNMLKYVFSSTMAKVNLTYMDNPKRGKEGGGSSLFGKYRYWKPPTIAELDVWKNFEKKFEYILKGKEKWQQITNGIDVNANLKIINGSALELTKHLDADSIDYIYTDPPYGGNIAYLDLSTMWNAWLFPDLFNGKSPKMDEFKKDEIIEGGDLKKTQKNYEDLFSQSFEQMAIVLKRDKWLSCVFAHKKLEFWNVIVESCENGGIEFKGSVYQPTNNSSMHFKANPSNVLCSQRIANFQKTFSVAIREKPDDLKKFILNEIERACLSGNGAYIDKIYQTVLDRLLQNQILSEAKKKGYLNLTKMLEDDDLFYFDKDSKQYFVKKREDNYKAYKDDYFRKTNEVKVVLTEILSKNNASSIDYIYKELFDVFQADKRFPIDRDDIIPILHQIGYQSKKGGKWILSKNQFRQAEFDFNSGLDNKLVKIISGGSSHSETIFRLISIGGYLGYKSWIGKREQIADDFNGVKFSELSLKQLPLEKLLTKAQLNKIQQIDVIWFDDFGLPRYAFEVEESTTIVSGLERFKVLLEFDSTIARNLFIIAPISRRRKLLDTFTTSSYIGAPMYMENKVEFIFKENLATFYDNHIDKEFNENELKVVFETLREKV